MLKALQLKNFDISQIGGSTKYLQNNLKIQGTSRTFLCEVKYVLFQVPRRNWCLKAIFVFLVLSAQQSCTALVSSCQILEEIISLGEYTTK